MNMATIKATIFFDKRYWVSTFERTDKDEPIEIMVIELKALDTRN